MRVANLAAACLLAACSDPVADPKLAALEHDFGVIPHGEKREHEFLFDLKSLGEPYVPLRVHLDCSCGLADMRLRHRDGSERSIDGSPNPAFAAGPDETLVVHVVIDTNRKEAVDLPKTTSRGYIVLQPTRDQTGNLRLNWPLVLRFGIDAPVVLHPFAALDFGRIPVSGTGEMITTLRGDEQHQDLKFGPVASTDPHVTLELEPAADNIVLRARCQPGEPGNYRAIVAIDTSLPGYRVHLDATWKVVPDLEASPMAKVSFRADLSRAQNGAEAASQFVLVTDHDARRSPEFTVHQIVGDDGRDVRKSFEVTLVPIPGQARQHRMLVRYVGGLVLGLRGKVVLTKDGATGPFLPIELVVFPTKS